MPFYRSTLFFFSLDFKSIVGFCRFIESKYTILLFIFKLEIWYLKWALTLVTLYLLWGIYYTTYHCLVRVETILTFKITKCEDFIFLNTITNSFSSYVLFATIAIIIIIVIIFEVFLGWAIVIKIILNVVGWLFQWV